MFENIKVTGNPLIVSTDAEVDAAEAELGIRFPAGYREFVTRFGHGILECIRVFLPSVILHGPQNVHEFRRRIDEFWFWDEGRDVLSKETALQSVSVGDTVYGDDLIVHPGDPDRIFLLSRDHETIFDIGEGLEAAFEWIFNWDHFESPIEERNFVPYRAPPAR